MRLLLHLFNDNVVLLQAFSKLQMIRGLTKLCIRVFETFLILKCYIAHA